MKLVPSLLNNNLQISFGKVVLFGIGFWAIAEIPACWRPSTRSIRVSCTSSSSPCIRHGHSGSEPWLDSHYCVSWSFSYHWRWSCTDGDSIFRRKRWNRLSIVNRGSKKSFVLWPKNHFLRQLESSTTHHSILREKLDPCLFFILLVRPSFTPNFDKWCQNHSFFTIFEIFKFQSPKLETKNYFLWKSNLVYTGGGLWYF